MDSRVITCIQSALDDLMKFHITSKAQELIFELRNLKIFVLCARKLGKDQSLRPLFIWVENVVGRKAREISAADYSFQIESLVEEIHDWYMTIFDHTRALPSSSLKVSEVLILLNCILENLVDIHNFRSSKFPVDELREQMTSLKCVVECASQISLEAGSRDHLMAHTEAVAVDAAYLIFTSRIDKSDQGMEFKVSSLLQLIKPVDPRVYEIYTQVLRSFKCSIPSLPPTRGFDEMKLLLTSLTANLWRMLRLNTCHLLPIKYQLQDLYAGLQSLTTALDRSESSDPKMKGGIGAVVCDAGVLVCSLYQTEVDLGLLQSLSGTIKFIQADIGEKDPLLLVPPVFNFQKSYELDFIDVLSEKLMELISCGAEPTAASCLQTIQEKLVFLRHFLGGNVELCNELRALWDGVMEVAYKMHSLIDYLKVGDLPYSILPLFGSIVKDIGSIKADVLKVFHHKREKITVNEETWTSRSHQVQSLRTPTITNEMVGRHDDEMLILDQLLGGSAHLRIIAIVGMPGIGKTTLATKVYNNPSISLHFSVRAWCPISQEVDKKKVFLELLNQIAPWERFEKTEEQYLEEKLKSRLGGEKYLILLDDVLDIKAWDALKKSLPDDNNASRIIVTSRDHHIAPDDMLVDSHPHIVGELSRDDSLELLLMKTLAGLRGLPPTFWDLSTQIVDICGGFPEAIVFAAGLLVTTDPGHWKEILDGLIPGVESSELCMSTLDLSYKHLPHHLRSCFLCLATFPKDEDISVWRLLRLWNAERFVQNDLTKSPEDVAEKYLEVLIGRGLIMVAKRRSDGGIKACRVQGLVHEFCIDKAKDEKFYHFVNRFDELSAFNDQQDLSRLSIVSKLEHFKEPKLFCPRAHSLAFNPSQQTKREEEEWFQDVSFLTYTFKLLRVLDLEQINVGNVFPSEIELLVRLVFLAIRGKMGDIPSSISNLSYLETLIVDSGNNTLSLPASLWSLLNLQYIYIMSSRSSGGATLPITNLESSSALTGLERFSGAVIPSWSNMERLMRKFPNIRKLKCRQDKDDAENLDKTVVLDFLCQLQSLDLSSSDGFQFKFSFPANLKKLTLSGFHLLARKISTIGEMPNLEVLKLLDVSFARDTWEMKEGEFSKLKVLKLHSPGLVSWGAPEEGLENFKRLILDGCRVLEKIPEVLEEILTLEVIKVYNCSKTVVSSVKKIQAVQMDMGNEDLKVSIKDVSDD